MKNHPIHEQRDTVRYTTRVVVNTVCFIVGLFVKENGHAQFYNNGTAIIQDKTILSVYENYENDELGNFTNDGELYIFRDWMNNGSVNFTPSTKGKTFFYGISNQYVEGSKQSNFQNIEFKNTSDAIPFFLGTTITVNTKAEFVNGIIDGVDLPDGLVIFNETAIHVNTSDLSFVNGKVQKIGGTPFEYPIGDDLYFRPSYSATGSNGNVYTAQYFYKNSAEIHNHSSKDPIIHLINNTEYWTVTKDEGSDKLILSLTMDSRTTPSEFFNLSTNEEVVIVRWDESSGKWIKEGGATSDKMSDSSLGAGYTQLVTSEVNGYGIFTIAIADKKEPENKDLVIYNALSPNGDGINDTFHIKGINEYPDNTVEIYNRWGVKVFETRGYNEGDNVFAGYSDGRATINRNEKLPTGTYFYILKYSKNNSTKEKTGYLYINNQ